MKAVDGELRRVKRRGDPVSLLDAGMLPVEELAAFAHRESSRPRAAYLAHKWFARRFGSSMRALLVAAVTPLGDDFWDAYYGRSAHDLTGLTVLDPFVGGGTIVYEAQRLGASVIGVDVDPVACAITSFELRASSSPPLHEALDELWTNVGKEQAEFYRTTCGTEDRVGLHFLWVQQVPCGACGDSYDGHPSHLLGRDGARSWVVCPSCGDVCSINAKWATYRCDCGTRVQVERGAIRAGEGCCPHCGHNERLIDVGRRTGRPTFRLFAVESIPADHRRRVLISDRKFARADAADMARFDSAAALLHQFRSNVPRREIPRAGRVDTRLLDYGYHCYAELFNDRQLLHLAKLVGAVRDLAPEFREPMALALSNHTTSSNMMTSYTSNWRQATPLFAIRAFRHSPRPVELNPWLAGVGRGTFPNAVRKVEGARRYSQNPTELASSGSRVVPRVPHGDVLVLNQDSGSLKSVPDASIDLVVTDPPYFDYIAYSELSDWFVPWLAGTGLIPRRAASASPQTLASPGRGSIDAEQFSRKLTTVMCELRRVLRPGGRLVFTFQHRSPRAWLALASALHAAGFEAVNVFPLKGDGDEGLHHHNGSSTWDAVLVCRPSHPSTSQPTLAGPRHVEVLRDHAAGWIKRLDLGSSDAAVISFASLVAGALGFGRTRERRRLDLAAVLATVERPQTPAAADVAQHDLLDGTRT